MRYEVSAYGAIHSSHRTKPAAIEIAEAMPQEAAAMVVAHEISGSYESVTCVWPTVGETHQICG
jgi:hypothetical protein